MKDEPVCLYGIGSLLHSQTLPLITKMTKMTSSKVSEGRLNSSTESCSCSTRGCRLCCLHVLLWSHRHLCPSVEQAYSTPAPSSYKGVYAYLAAQTCSVKKPEDNQQNRHSAISQPPQCRGMLIIWKVTSHFHR